MIYIFIYIFSNDHILVATACSSKMGVTPVRVSKNMISLQMPVIHVQFESVCFHVFVCMGTRDSTHELAVSQVR